MAVAPQAAGRGPHPLPAPTHGGAGRSAVLSVLATRLGGLTWRFRRSLPGWCALGGFQGIQFGGHDAGNGRAQDEQQHVPCAGIEGLDTLHHGGSDIGVEEMIVGTGMAAVGKTIQDAGLLDSARAKLLAVRRRDGTLHLNPTADLQLEEGDLVIALGSEEQLIASAASLK